MKFRHFKVENFSISIDAIVINPLINLIFLIEQKIIFNLKYIYRIFVIIFIVYLIFNIYSFLGEKSLFVIIVSSVFLLIFILFMIYFLSILERDLNKFTFEKVNEKEIYFASFFINNSFENFKKIALINNIIDLNGNFIYSKKNRDSYILVYKLIETSALKDDNVNQLCKAATIFFNIKVDNSRVNDLLIHGLKNNDHQSYTYFTVFNMIIDNNIVN